MTLTASVGLALWHECIRNPRPGQARTLVTSVTRPQGVTVTHMAPNGAMGKAGFEVQDMLLAIDRQPIENTESLVTLTAALKPQQRITVLALDHRSGNTGDVQVVIDQPEPAETHSLLPTAPSGHDV
jgi:S1-C subfamily serine protease